MTFVHELADKLAHQKASMIDASLARFLTEQGFKTDEWTVDAMRSELKSKGFEILHELHRYAESEVHTFKLCRVVTSSSLNIPTPHVVIAP